MTHSPSQSGLTLIESIVLVAIIAVLIALLLPTLGAFRRSQRHLQNSTQIRGIHQGMMTFSQKSYRGGFDGFFPGLNSRGDVVPNGEATGFSGDGTHPAARLWVMLDDNIFTPEYIINPADERAVVYEYAPSGETDPNFPMTAQNYSYAMLGIAEALNQDEDGNFAPGDDTRALEWNDTLNTSSPMLSDRAIGTGAGDISSVWTEPGSGDWRGTIVRNDNSSSFENSSVIEQTQFGNGNVNTFDDMFADAPDVTDTFLVHRDATTAYSAD